MDLNKIHEITFNTEESIITASLSAVNEWIMLMSSGKVIRYKINEPTGQYLFSVKSDIGYSDGGFDINSPTTIYTLDSIVVVTNDYKTHGFIHYPEKYNSLHLWRKDYHADISCYPIALFKSASGIPHIVYGVAWNHIQIMNLDTRQVLTATKSLIEENAEERHIEFYKKYKEENKLAWPSEYDYFFGKLYISPDQKNFLSAGWAWGSYDSYRIFEIDHFINSNRITDKHIVGGEHCNRAVCWIDNTTIAVTYNPYIEGDEGSTKDSPCEIHFYNINSVEPEIINKIKIEVDILSAKIHYNNYLNAIIAFSKNIGLIILSLDGTILFHNRDLEIDSYHSETNLLIKTKDKTISIYGIRS